MPDCRLIYRSTASEEIVPNETLRDIVEKGRENNALKGITGLLVLSGDQFLQVLEGDPAEVNRLYIRIASDSRHKDIGLITYESIAARLFNDWNMRLVDLWDLPGGLRESFLAKYPQREQIFQIPDLLPEVYSLLLDAKALSLSTPLKSLH